MIQSIQNSNSSFTQTEMVAWELEIYPCEHTLTLQQSGGALSPEHLSHCGQCSLSKNLWLCLTCGTIGCGRKQYDGSGGNNHGTITPDGNASLYCYSCDTDVKDEQIAQHLINFGLDVSRQTKTERTMAEMVTLQCPPPPF